MKAASPRSENQREITLSRGAILPASPRGEGNRVTESLQRVQLELSVCCICIVFLVYLVVKTSHWPRAFPEETLLVCPWSGRLSSCRKSSAKVVFTVHSSYITAHLSQMPFLEGCRQTKPHKIIVCSWLGVLWTQLPDQKATFTCSLTSAGIANYCSSTEELCYQVLEIYYSAMHFSPPPPEITYIFPYKSPVIDYFPLCPQKILSLSLQEQCIGE